LKDVLYFPQHLLQIDFAEYRYRCNDYKHTK